MRKLEEHVRKNGFNYSLVKRSENNAVYKQDCGDGVYYYEVFKIIKAQDFTLGGNLVEAHECFAGNEAFGVSAWSFRSLDKAMLRFEELEKMVGG